MVQIHENKICKKKKNHTYAHTEYAAWNILKKKGTKRQKKKRSLQSNIIKKNRSNKKKGVILQTKKHNK